MPAGPRLARRTTLALAAGAVVLAGCDDGDGGDGGEPGTAPTDTPDPDVALVAAVVAELTRAQRVAAAAGETDLVALHGAHLAALDETPAPGPARGTFDSADAQQHERRLQAHLVDAAVAARSGALAALLASMSAAVAQRLADQRPAVR